MPPARTAVLLAAFVGVFAAAVARAQAPDDVLQLDGARAPLWVGSRALLAVDVDPALTLDDVLAGAVPFRRVDADRPSFRVGAGVIWLRFTVRAGADEGPWVLAFGHPRPREVDLYWTGEDGVRHVKRAGLVKRADEHDIAARAVVVRLPVPAGGERTFHARLAAYPLGFSATLQPEAQLHADEALASGLLGLYYGGALALLVYNLVLFALLGRRAYLYYAGLAVMHVLFFLGRNGWFWRFGLWSSTPRHVGGLIASLHVALLVLFTIEVLATRATAPRLHRVARWLVGAALANAVLAGLGLGVVSDPSGIWLGLAAAILTGAIAVRQWLARRPGAGSYLVGFSAFLVGLFLYAAKFAGWVPHDAFTEHALQLGSALDLVFSALALAYHVRAAEAQQRAAEHRAELVAAERDREVARLRAEALARSLRAQDDERRRIARDLHDGIGHLLLRVRGAVGALGQGAPELDALVTEGLEGVRAISRDLYPTALDALGLSGALQAAAEQSVRHSDVRLSLAIDRIDDLVDRAAHADVYRSVQEALRNALAHAEPGMVSVEAYREGDEVIVAVGDDGRGFREGVTDGSGLRNMRERAALAGGRLATDSAPGGGTRVELRLPVRSAPSGSGKASA